MGGWRLSGDAILYSGFPLTMYSPYDYNVYANEIHAIQYRKMKIVHRSLDDWFGTDPSAVPCLNFDANGNTIDNGTCAYGSESFNGFGNASNGSERAPGYRKIDLGAFKVFRITEGQTLELRGEGFNAFNMASYGPPDSYLPAYNPNPAANYLGKITYTNSSQRILQVSLHYKF